MFSAEEAIKTLIQKTLPEEFADLVRQLGLEMEEKT
jgi:hypothetical protein